MAKHRGVTGGSLSCTLFPMTVALFSMAVALPTQSSTTTVSSPQIININQAAVFTCINESYPSSTLPMLFPPSDYTATLIDNITSAAIWHRYSIRQFCVAKEPQEYIQCVQKKLRNPTADIDKLISVYIDAENYGTAFNLYCNNSALIQNQFECTLNATVKSPCSVGGISGIIDQVYDALVANITQGEFCDTMKASIECRVGCQLQVCDQRFASIMEEFYHYLIGNYCRKQTSAVPLTCQPL